MWEYNVITELKIIYKDKNNTYSAQMSPRMAVEMFMQCNWHKVEILNLPDGSQTAFRKVQE